MDLIEGIRSGDRDAIKSAYTQNIDYIYGFSLSLTDDHDTALEIANKAFAILFRRIQQGETPENMRTAAARIAYIEAKKVETGTAYARESGQTAEAASQGGTGRGQAGVRNEDAKREADAQPERKDCGGIGENRKADISAAAPESSWKPSRKAEGGSTEETGKSGTPGDIRVPVPWQQADAPASGSRIKENAGLRSQEESRPGIENRPSPMPATTRTATEESANRVVPDKVGPDKAGIAIPGPGATTEQAAQEKPTGRAIAEQTGTEIRKPAADGREEIPPVKHPVIRTVIIILNIILIMALVWAGIAVLQDKGIMPTSLDLGYTWFNENIFPLF